MDEHLEITIQVFKALVEHIREGGSFRYLIYDRLGFNSNAYIDLYNAGGMIISNFINDKKDKI